MSSARLSNYAKRVNPTGQKRTAKLKVFNANGKVNRTLLRKLDENPLSYKLPRQFIYINDTNTIEQADQWLTSDRQMRMTLEDEYEVVGSNFIQTKWGNEQMASTYAFESMVATFNSPVRNKLAFDSVGREVFQRFKKKFKQQIKLHKGIRFQFAFEVQFKNSRQEEEDPFWISVSSDTITDIRNFPRVVREGVRDIKTKITELQKKGSGLIFIKAHNVSANVLSYNPTRGGTYLPTPDKIKNPKYGLINVINNKQKDECFVDAVLACLYYNEIDKNRTRATMYKQWRGELIIKMFKDFPIEANSSKIDSFERKNNISLNIYQYTDGQTYILRQTTLAPPAEEGLGGRRTANLLLISNKEGTQHHYIAATNMSALLCKQTSKHKEKVYPCQYCLHTYTSETALKNHQQYCAKHDSIKTEMPEEGSVMKFKNHFHQVKGSGIIYADFESFNMKIEGELPTTASFTHKIAQQTPNSYKLLGVCVNGKQFKRIHNITKEESKKVIEVGDLVLKYDRKGVEYTVEKQTGMVDTEGHPYQEYTIKDSENNLETVKAVDVYKVNLFMKKFFKDLTYIENLMRKEFQRKRDIKHMTISETEKGEYTKATKCYLCGDKFPKSVAEVELTEEETKKIREKLEKEKKSEDSIKKELMTARKAKWSSKLKCRDHNHCTGAYIGPACVKCNINRNDQHYKIPVVFHNLKGYDSKFIIRECAEMTKRFLRDKREKLEPMIKQAEETLKKTQQELDDLNYNHLKEAEELFDDDEEQITKYVENKDKDYKINLRLRKMELTKSIPNYHKRLNQLPKVDVIPLNSEQYLSFGIGGLRFLDSMAFMASGLDKLVNNLEPQDKQLTRAYFKKKYKGKNIDLLMKKGVYPYSWVNTREKFEQDYLPKRADFYNDIDEKGCSEKDYKHAQQVWDEFKCKTFKDYSNLYLECDVYLLADVFETFRDLMLRTHKLDPAYYFSLPQLSWDAMLKMTGIELDLLSDPDLYLMIENGIRGGVSFISHRKGEANNKYMGEKHDKGKSSKYITYFDVNNLYGYEMMKPLGYKGFRWSDASKFKVSASNHDKNLKMIKKLVKCKDPDKDHTGYVMEVDLDYPKDLHHLHNAFPLLPENINIEERCYSHYQQSCLEKTDGKASKVPKLIPTLRNKRKYVLDIRLLLCAMEHGLRLTKIHRAIEFTQKNWLKAYIEHNSKLRAAAKNEFEKDFYKLLNNAVFGKTMENMRNRIDFELITDKERFEKAQRNPRLKMPVHTFGNDCVGVQYSKKKIKLNKPIYCGLQILDMSKITMYDFHYNRMMKAYGPERVKLLFTDTDSFAYLIETEDVYKDMATLKEFKVGEEGNTIFDTSNYTSQFITTNPTDEDGNVFQGPPTKFELDNPDLAKQMMSLFSKKNKKVPGYMKDEAGGRVIISFIGLRAKMYSYETVCSNGNIKHSKTHKGIKKKMAITHSEYEECLANQQCNFKEWNTLRSKKHEMFVTRIKKKALSPMDDKSYILEDGISSLKWGHHAIPSEKNIFGSCNNVAIAVC